MRSTRAAILGGGLAFALALPTGAIAHAGPAPDVAASGSPFIIGGTIVAAAPWSAQVYLNGVFNCSGTLIAPRFVLTAKHCVGVGLSVLVGNVVRGQGTLANVVSYQSAPNGADISVLELDRAAGDSFSSLSGSLPLAGSTNDIYGWGRTSLEGTVSPQLKTATVQVTNTDCRDFTAGQAICSVGGNGVAWFGDSGGPQLDGGLQVGVASTADGVTAQTYTAVAPNLSWIMSLIGGG